jgi:hypothetical protein
MAAMAHKHEPEIPVALEAVVSRLGELEVVLGPKITPVLEAVRTGLIAAMAARDRGDVPGAVEQISQAMHRLAGFADQLDPAEATLMRALAQTFRNALLRGNDADAKQSAAVMFQKAGATERKKD